MVAGWGGRVRFFVLVDWGGRSVMSAGHAFRTMAGTVKVAGQSLSLGCRPFQGSFGDGFVPRACALGCSCFAANAAFSLSLFALGVAGLAAGFHWQRGCFVCPPSPLAPLISLPRFAAERGRSLVRSVFGPCCSRRAKLVARINKRETWELDRAMLGRVSSPGTRRRADFAARGPSAFSEDSLRGPSRGIARSHS